MPAKVTIRWFTSDGGQYKPAPFVAGTGETITRKVTANTMTADPVMQTRLLWGELHKRGLAQNGRDDDAWLKAFADRLPCGQCRNDWERMQKETPPTWDDYFAWTVARHNEVNRMLKKTEVSVEEALEIWT